MQAGFKSVGESQGGKLLFAGSSRFPFLPRVIFSLSSIRPPINCRINFLDRVLARGTSVNNPSSLYTFPPPTISRLFHFGYREKFIRYRYRSVYKEVRYRRVLARRKALIHFLPTPAYNHTACTFCSALFFFFGCVYRLRAKLQIMIFRVPRFP